MRRESHVRFCERAGVRFPRATRLVMMFRYKDDAQRVLEVLAKRLGRFGLQIHPDKTHLVDFRAVRKPLHDDDDAALATSFNFLGFTHVWGRSRWGKAVVRRRTAKDRFARALAEINEQCRHMRHGPLRDQHRSLCLKLNGHIAYFGITGNFRRVALLIHQARRC